MKVWDLPGGQRYIDEICDGLRTGNSVVARFPFEVPEGFDAAVERNLYEILTIRTISARSKPIRDIADQLAAHADRVHRIPDLLEDPNFRGCLVRVRTLDQPEWAIWCDFLRKFAELNRSRPLLDRCVILVTLRDVPAKSRLVDVGLFDLEWHRFLDEFDLLLFANERLREHGHSPVMHSLLAHTIAYVSSLDVHTAENLADQHPKTILEPFEFLRKSQDCRANGTDLADADKLETDESSVERTDKTIHQVWRAQLMVLLPWIELQAREIVDRHIDEVRRHLRAKGDYQSDPYSLEIGELYEIFRHRLATKRIREAFKLLRHARNRLAHKSHMQFDEIKRLISEPIFSTRDLN